MSDTVPETAKKPQDRKPAKKTAAQREAEGDATVSIEHRGKTYELPADPQDWPVKVARAYEDGKQTTAAAMLIESAGTDVDDWTNRRLNEFFEIYAGEIGLLEGE